MGNISKIAAYKNTLSMIENFLRGRFNIHFDKTEGLLLKTKIETLSASTTLAYSKDMEVDSNFDYRVHTERAYSRGNFVRHKTAGVDVPRPTRLFSFLAVGSQYLVTSHKFCVDSLHL